MKLLAVFLLVGLALASAVPLFDDDLETELDQIADELGDEFIVYSEGGLGAKLRKRFEELIERIKKGVDEGKGVDGDLLKKAEDFYNKLKNLGFEVSEKFKEIFEDLRSKLGGNSLEHADWKDWKDRLRQLRDRIQNHEFNEEKIRAFIENLFGKSEMTNQFLEMLKTKGEKGKQRIIDFINRILGEKQEAFSPHADWKERLRLLRDKIQNHEIDEVKFRDFIEKMFGKSQIANQFLELVKTKGEQGRQRIVDLINRILGEEQEAFAPQRADLRELLRQLRDKLQQNHVFEEAEILALLQDTFGMNELANQAREMLNQEGGKQRLVEFLNRILCDKQEAFAPQRADFREHLRQLRDRIQNHKFDAERIRALVEKLFGKSEMTNQLIEKIKTVGETGKQKLIDFINRILGDKQEAFAPQQRNFRELLRRLREKIQQNEHDEVEFMVLVMETFGQNEIMTQVLEMLKRGDSKQRLLDFIDRVLGDKQEAFQSITDKMQEQFEKMLEKLKKSMEDGKTVSENAWKKAQDTYEKLSNLGVEFNEKIKQIFEELKGKFGKNSVPHVQFAIFSRIKERLENLISRMHKDMEDGKGVRGDFMKKLTDVYEKFKGLGGEMNGKFKEMFERLKSKFDKSSPAVHSVKEIYEKVNKFFRDLNIELKERFVKFGEYVKEQYHKGLEKTKSDIDNVKNIAHKFVDDSRKISKDLAEEALEFFRQYKDELGHIYEDVVDKVRDILKKED